MDNTNQPGAEDLTTAAAAPEAAVAMPPAPTPGQSGRGAVETDPRVAALKSSTGWTIPRPVK